MYKCLNKFIKISNGIDKMYLRCMTREKAFVMPVRLDILHQKLIYFPPAKFRHVSSTLIK